MPGNTHSPSVWSLKKRDLVSLQTCCAVQRFRRAFRERHWILFLRRVRLYFGQKRERKQPCTNKSDVKSVMQKSIMWNLESEVQKPNGQNLKHPITCHSAFNPRASSASGIDKKKTQYLLQISQELVLCRGHGHDKRYFFSNIPNLGNPVETSATIHAGGDGGGGGGGGECRPWWVSASSGSMKWCRL